MQTNAFIRSIHLDPKGFPGNLRAQKTMNKAIRFRDHMETDYIGQSLRLLDKVKEHMERFVSSVEVLREIPKEETDALIHNALYRPDKIDAMYSCYDVPKKSGGTRRIEAPSKVLKLVQRAILDKVLPKLCPPSHMAYGFVPRRNIKKNAMKHAVQERVDNTGKWLYKVDLKDFFPSIRSIDFLYSIVDEKIPDYYRLDYSNLNGHVRPFMMDALMIVYFCFYKERLPQGAPTSPAISNYVMRSFDIKAAGAIKSISKEQAIYTRYADDLCISGDSRDAVAMSGNVLLDLIHKHTGCRINYKKIALCRHGRPMRVTGININHGTTISRWKRDIVRARLHNAIKEGKINTKDKAQLTGYMAFYSGVDKAGWENRCGSLYKQMLTLPVEGA